jgi:hypothetical protein
MPRHPHHDSQEYRDREHAGYLSEQSRYGTFTDLDVVRQLALDREEKERREKQATEEKKD